MSVQRLDIDPDNDDVTCYWILGHDIACHHDQGLQCSDGGQLLRFQPCLRRKVGKCLSVRVGRETIHSCFECPKT